MKKIFLLLIILTATVFSFGQKDSTYPPPYLQYPTVPPFKLLEADSTLFTKDDLSKNKPVLIILFDPSCDHCKHETEEIISKIDSFKNIQIVMITNAEFAELKKFYRNY